LGDKYQKREDKHKQSWASNTLPQDHTSKVDFRRQEIFPTYECLLLLASNAVHGGGCLRRTRASCHGQNYALSKSKLGCFLTPLPTMFGFTIPLLFNYTEKSF